MKVETENLKKMETYARMHGVSRTYISNLVNNGDPRISTVEIDGTIFIDIMQSSYKPRHNPGAKPKEEFEV